jgi:hypothetical protein
MKIKNLHYSIVGQTSTVDCEVWSVDLNEWLPCTVPLDGSDKPTKEMADYINKRFSHEDLNKVMVDNYLQPVTDEILSKEKREKEKALKEEKTIYLNACAKEAIVNGFESQATGKTLLYPSNLEDQQNLTNFLLAGSDCYLFCSDKGTWKRVLHTEDEVRLVLKEFNTHKESVLSKLDGLKAKLARVHADFSIEAVMWD